MPYYVLYNHLLQNLLGFYVWSTGEALIVNEYMVVVGDLRKDIISQQKGRLLLLL